MTERRVLQVMGQSTGGVGRHVAELTRAVDGTEGLSIDIAAPPDLRIPMPKTVLPVRIPSGPLRGHPSAIRTLIRLLRSGAYDLVHGHGLRAGLDAAIAARRAHVPAVVTLHNLMVADVSGALRARAWGWVEPLTVRLSIKTFVPSREMAATLRARTRLPDDRIEVLYAGVAEPPVPSRSSSEVRAELGVHGRLVVTVARLHPQKALGAMLDALALLPVDVTLAVVGEGPQAEELAARARALGISDRIRWLGQREDAIDFIAAADVFCLSSLWEAVPLAAQEAVLLDVPVVATAVGGLPELIADGRSGRLVPVNDATALGKALAEMLADDDLRRTYARAARLDYDVTFSRKAILDRLRRLYLDDAPR